MWSHGLEGLLMLARCREHGSVVRKSHLNEYMDGPEILQYIYPHYEVQRRRRRQRNASNEDEDDEDGSAASQSSSDDDLVDIENERPQFFAPDDNLMNFDNQPISRGKHSRSSSMSMSSRASAPPDTDLDGDNVGNGGQEEEEQAMPYDFTPPSPRKPTKKTSRKKNTTAQQAKYDDEKPVVRSKEVMHAPKKTEPAEETEWPASTRLTFPPTGGSIRIPKQSTLLQRILHAAIEEQAFQIAFVAGYDSSTTRATARLRREPQGKGKDIAKRAKKDTDWCARIAPSIWVRGSNIHSELRSLAISVVPTLYELNRAGVMISEIKKIVALLLKNL
ncbi:hypothetical protein FB45DRAFT_878294 [Roridomyces roridus]|uniref:Uncharacterized protein n=1 Tax=Roridomyces roridus TaxID=1738132 RepID=A0AAD7B1K3_9AGAR|nr:hypothetical protein FB45DRAFT_878294 [Roridomyces roridus]